MAEKHQMVMSHMTTPAEDYMNSWKLCLRLPKSLHFLAQATKLWT